MAKLPVKDGLPGGVGGIMLTLNLPQIVMGLMAHALSELSSRRDLRPTLKLSKHLLPVNLVYFPAKLQRH